MLFYALMMYKWLNGLFLYQLQPSFFYLRKDGFTWLFMQTGIHKWLLDNKTGWIIFDIFFYSMPALYLISYFYKKNLSLFAALLMLIVNWVYVQCYTLYPSNSIEGHVAWLLFPLAFVAKDEKTFILLFKGLRYFFLFVIASAGIWKIAQGGLFNVEQMSGILLLQHGQLLTNSPQYWQSNFIRYLAANPLLSYFLYLITALMELIFFTGFFTKKYDFILLLFLVIFLIANYFVMRIAYFEISPFLLTLLFKTDQPAFVVKKKH